MPEFGAYEQFIGADALGEIRQVARAIGGRTVLHVNSTPVGGGVAEILTRMVPLLNQLEVHSRWDVIKGGEQFFGFTKRVHNALHGQPEVFTKDDRDLFEATTQANLQDMDLTADFVLIHDPQPIGLVQSRERLGGHWAWRCHIDFSRPEPAVWELLEP